MDNLNRVYRELEAFVESFQNNNEEYIKITKTVEEKVVCVLSNGKVLLKCALLSITESARNDPEKYKLIFYNISSIIDCYNTNEKCQYCSRTNDWTSLFPKCKTSPEWLLPWPLAVRITKLVLNELNHQSYKDVKIW